MRYIEENKEVFPNSKVIEISQNRLKEKRFLNSIQGIKTAEFRNVRNFNDLKNASEEFNFKCILKSKEFGYDGKGQYKVDQTNLEGFKNFELKNFILEQFVNFKKEISVIVVRSKEFITNYPPVENIHVNSILRESFYPAKITKKIKNLAIEKSIQIAEKISLNGVLAVEMFITDKDQILINELAPRPHNSGHWSMDACDESQYDNLINSIFFKKPVKPSIKSNCRMINLIGKDYKKINKLNKKFKCYDYFKTEVRESRKMGHYVILY